MMSTTKIHALYLLKSLRNGIYKNITQDSTITQRKACIVTNMYMRLIQTIVNTKYHKNIDRIKYIQCLCRQVYKRRLDCMYMRTRICSK